MLLKERVEGMLDKIIATSAASLFSREVLHTPKVVLCIVRLCCTTTDNATEPQLRTTRKVHYESVARQRADVMCDCAVAIPFSEHGVTRRRIHQLHDRKTPLPAQAIDCSAPVLRTGMWPSSCNHPVVPLDVRCSHASRNGRAMLATTLPRRTNGGYHEVSPQNSDNEHATRSAKYATKLGTPSIVSLFGNTVNKQITHESGCDPTTIIRCQTCRHRFDKQPHSTNVVPHVSLFGNLLELCHATHLS